MAKSEFDPEFRNSGRRVRESCPMGRGKFFLLGLGHSREFFEGSSSTKVRAGVSLIPDNMEIAPLEIQCPCALGGRIIFGYANNLSGALSDARSKARQACLENSTTEFRAFSALDTPR